MYKRQVLHKLVQHQLPHLKSLTVEGDGVSDEFAKTIAKITQLETLIINRSPITNEAVEHLTQLKGLTFLDLRNNNEITDEGLVHLKSLKNLRTLRLGSTGATPKGVDFLKQALPDCEVAW